MLLYEPPSNPEGMLAKQAMYELKELRLVRQRVEKSMKKANNKWRRREDAASKKSDPIPLLQMKTISFIKFELTMCYTLENVLLRKEKCQNTKWKYHEKFVMNLIFIQLISIYTDLYWSYILSIFTFRFQSLQTYMCKTHLNYRSVTNLKITCYIPNS